MYDKHTLTPQSPSKASESQSKASEPAGSGSGATATTSAAQEGQEVTLGALQRQFTNIAGEVGELARLVRGSVRSAANIAADKAEGAREETVERAREVEEEAAAWIRSRPFQASLVSMGLGAILWSLLKRS